MPYCPECGVELEPQARSCPLCGAAAVPDLEAGERKKAAGAARERTPSGPRIEGLVDREADEGLTPDEKTTIRWEVLSVSTFVAALAVCAVNLLGAGRLSWALYPLYSLALTWVVVTALLELRRLPLLGALIVGLAIPLFLLALDLIDGRLDWSLHIGMPIALITELSIALSVLALRLLKTGGLSIIAWALVAATLTCLGIEGTLSLALKGRIWIAWSGIVASASVPTALFLFYLHYRVNKVANLRRLFRL